MKRSRWIALGLALCIGLAAASAFPDRVYIDIADPGFQKLPVAIVNFHSLLPERGRSALPEWFPDALAGQLNLTGFFSTLPRASFLAHPNPFTPGGERLAYSDWRLIGAEYLVVGGYRHMGKDLAAEIKLYDVVKGEVLLEKRYMRRYDDRDRLVTDLARDILRVLTGDGSVFDTKIAFEKPRRGGSELFTVNFNGTAQTQITSYRSITLSPRWSPDGSRLSFTSYRDGNPDFFVRELRSGSTRKMAAYRGLNLSGAWSPDGSKVLLTLSYEGNQDIYAMDARTGRLKRLTTGFAINVSPCWSPDGRQIAFVSSRSGTPQIFVMDSDGGNVRRLTYEGNYNTSPSWSPKGNRIAYEGRMGGIFHIMTIAPDGTGVQRVSPGDTEYLYPSWSPDGRFLAVAVRKGKDYQLGIMNANGANLRLLGEGTKPSWSPVLQ